MELSYSCAAVNQISIDITIARRAVSEIAELLVKITTRYDARCYFNVRSKADMSQLKLPHRTNNQKVKNRKN